MTEPEILERRADLLKWGVIGWCGGIILAALIASWMLA